MKVLVATAIYPSPARPWYGTFVRSQVEALCGIGVDASPFVLTGRNSKLAYLQSMPVLRRRLADEHFDLVHAHYGYVGIVARTQFRVPVVLTFHGSDLMGGIDETGRATLFSRVAAGVGKRVAQGIDAVIVQTEEMARLLPRHPNVHVIPHEIDLELFRPVDREEARRQLDLDPQRKYLLFAAAPDKAVKRYPLARAAADRLSERDPLVELLVVHREPQGRLPLYMSACDALVFPSYQEGSPNIVKQAMACNLPIVSTDVGDVADVIGSTEWCHVVDPTLEAFVERLREILVVRPRTNGRNAVHHLAGPVVAGRVLDVYEQVLRTARAPRRRINRAAA